MACQEAFERVKTASRDPNHGIVMTKALFFDSLNGSNRIGRGVQGQDMLKVVYNEHSLAGMLVVRACVLDLDLRRNPLGQDVVLGFFSRLVVRVEPEDTDCGLVVGRYSSQSIHGFTAARMNDIDKHFAQADGEEEPDPFDEQLLRTETRHAMPVIQPPFRDSPSLAAVKAFRVETGHYEEQARHYRALVVGVGQDCPGGTGLLTPGSEGLMEQSTLGNVTQWMLDHASRPISEEGFPASRFKFSVF